MTDEQHEAYRSELNRPYSEKELGLHLADRDAKSLFEITHAHNYQLINLTAKWIEYTTGKGRRPSRNIWRYLTPGANNDNSACDRLNQLVEFYASFPYGTAPLLPIAFFCSRSTATLIARLEELHYTPHLDTIERAAKDFFTIVANEATRDFTPEQLKATLQKCVDDFVTGCEANAKELHKYLLDFNRARERILSDGVLTESAPTHRDKARAGKARRARIWGQGSRGGRTGQSRMLNSAVGVFALPCPQFEWYIRPRRVPCVRGGDVCAWGSDRGFRQSVRQAELQAQGV